MRTIKFRALGTFDKKFVYGFYVTDKTLTDNDPSNHTIWSNDGDGTWNDIDPNTLGQFTGITDKNGKEIFEGDVVRLCNDDFDGDHWDAEVIFQDYAWCLKYLDSENYDILSEYTRSHIIEVIGNIHENPELLK